MILTEDIFKLLLSLLLGGLIGIERQFRDKAAGFRTIILISVGTTLFTLISIKFGGSSDPSRIAAGIVTGIGFLGAGVIMQTRGQVVGLTTAATIWISSAIGIGIGIGEYYLSSLTAITIFIILLFFPKVESYMARIRHTYTYEITTQIDTEKLKEIPILINEMKMKVIKTEKFRKGDKIISTWVITGSYKNNKLLSEEMLLDMSIEEIKIT